MITLPQNFVANLITTMGNFIGDMMPLIFLVFAVFIGFFIVQALIEIFIRLKEETK